MSVYMVDKDAVLDILQDLRENDPFPEYRTAIREIERLPSTEAEPVVHAHWVDRYGYKYANKLYVCSRCGKKALYEIERDVLGHEHIVQSFTDRCPECGAHMDERYPNDL